MFAYNQHASLPLEPDFPTNFAENGYKVNAKGQIVQVSNESEFFPYHSTDNERFNEIKREAIHQAAREAVKEAAAEQGVKEYYLTGVNGDVIHTTKPYGPHLRFFATDLEELKHKKDVVIVIGEHTQDPGVWAWRHLMTEGGIDDGSVVGLAKKLNTIALEAAPKPKAETYKNMKAADKDRNDSVDYLSCGSKDGGMGREDPLALPRTPEGVNIAISHEDDRVDSVASGVTLPHVPGIIIFNPGQLLYSIVRNECLTMRTWMARPRSSALSGPCQIHPVQNRIRGHEDAYTHVETMFDKVIPQLLGDGYIRAWVVGIVDGAGNLIKYMDKKMAKDHSAKIGGLVSGIAFIESTHDATKLEAASLIFTLPKHAKSWIKSDKPVNKWIDTPGSMKALLSGVRGEGKPMKDQEKQENEDPGKKAIMDKPLAGSEPVVIEKPKSPTFPEVLVGDVPLALPSPIIEELTASNSTIGGFVPISQRHLQDDLPPEAFAYKLPDAISLPNSPTLDSAAGKDDEGSMADPNYECLDNVVSCHTYSGGTDVNEMIFPTSMDHVLAFFKLRADMEAGKGC